MRIRRSDVFFNWLKKLKDRTGKYLIEQRINRLEKGNLGDVESIGEGCSEMKISYGPGYRVYFTNIGTAIIILLCGGDKSTQHQDIERAKKMAKLYKE